VIVNLSMILPVTFGRLTVIGLCLFLLWTSQAYLAVSHHKHELLNPRGPLYSLSTRESTETRFPNRLDGLETRFLVFWFRNSVWEPRKLMGARGFDRCEHRPQACAPHMALALCSGPFSRLGLTSTNASCPRLVSCCFESTRWLRPDPCSARRLQSH